jgi:glycine/D-amino acid oxidase-like deaminating enzyme
MAGVATLGSRQRADCAGLLPSPGWAAEEAKKRVAKVLVSQDRIIRTVVGLRPFRPSGFVVRAEQLEKKALIHNYGHGGGGVTLSWGTAHLAMEEALKTGHTQFAIIGCGAVGLATARLLQRRGLDVTIYAKDVPPNTTSNIACAQWSPFSVFDRDRSTPMFEGQFTRATQLSYRYFQELVGDYYGVRWVENYICVDTPFVEKLSELQASFPEARELRKTEHPFNVRYARRFMTMIIETPIYLNAIMRDFLLTGGRISVREFKSAGELLALPEPAIVNCTGLGAKGLFNDNELMPIKGQLTILLPQAEVNYGLDLDDLYMYPRRDGILLGGTYERNVWTLEPDQKKAEQVLDGHKKFFNGMKSPNI